MPDPDPAPKPSIGRTILRAAFLFVFGFGSILGAGLVLAPDSPLPNQWNPTRPLAVADPISPLTGWKLRAALASPAVCQATLAGAATISARTDVASDNPNCGIPDAVTLRRVGAARLDQLQTACPTALRLAMWEHHGVQPAAEEHLGAAVTRITTAGSYNCRRIRTSSGASNRWSTHATGMAVDVTGFDTEDGARLRLLQDWDGAPAAQAFFRAVRDSGCRWFATTLGPDYNRLHADHFHLQATGWGTCR